MRTLAGALVLLTAAAARAQAPAAVQVAAIPEIVTIAAGGAFRVAVRLRVPEGHHISWTNPGQTGLPTTLVWRTPSGVTPEETQWPYPERDTTAGWVSHVYRGVVVVVTRFRVDSSLREGAAVLRAELSWGLCGATCIPQKDTVTLSIPVRRGRGETSGVWRSLQPSLGAQPDMGERLVVRADARDNGVRLAITGSRLRPSAGGAATFFPLPRASAVVVAVRHAGRGVTLTLPARDYRVRQGRLAGVLVFDQPWLVGSQRRALAVDAVIE